MEATVIVDSQSRGHYTGEEIQSVAASHGWAGPELEADDEFYSEAWDEAMNFLMGLPADANGSVYFEHEDGSLMFGDAQAYYDEADAA